MEEFKQSPSLDNESKQDILEWTDYIKDYSGQDKIKSYAHILYQISYNLEKNNNQELLIKAVEASVSTGLQSLKTANSIGEIAEILGHYLVKPVMVHTLRNEELKHRSYTQKVAELVAYYYEIGNDPVQKQKPILIYQRLSEMYPEKYREKYEYLLAKIDEKSDMVSEPDETIANNFMNYVKETLDSLSNDPIMSIDPEAVFQEFVELAKK
ncbi:MAG: hypothetical protein AAB446_01680 [Patescibacteria group bacterium]